MVGSFEPEEGTKPYFWWLIKHAYLLLMQNHRRTMKNILIAGGSGLVGKHMTQVLRNRGYQVAWLSRTKSEGNYQWNPAKGTIDLLAIQWADAIINLAGAGIADERWTASRKIELISSRTQSAATIESALQSLGKTNIPYLTASAIGIYGDSADEVLTETTPPKGADTFMVKCCTAWENAAKNIANLGIPTTLFRIGIVLDKTGGALIEIIKPMRFGIGAWFGQGNMWMSWIHQDDLAGMFIWALENQKTGVFNAVSPHPERNKAFTKCTRDVFHSSALLVPAPSFGLKLALGEMSAVVLNSNRVSSEKIVQQGYQFKYPKLKAALENCAAAV
jgi:uncharacterized protein